MSQTTVPPMWRRAGIFTKALPQWTKLGEHGGWSAWEHPTKGDTAPMLATAMDRHGVFVTDAWDIESFVEQIDQAEEDRRRRFEATMGTD